jgi:tetratricopeptide (TPR) repeat protein
MENDQPEDARASFEQALRLHSGELLANYGMGVLAFRAKQWDDARQWFNKARAVNPTQVEIPYYIALTYHRQQDNKTAKAYMEQAHDLMDDAGDKRRTDAKRWLREFDKLIKEAARSGEDTPTQRELPIQGAAGELTAGEDEEDD